MAKGGYVRLKRRPSDIIESSSFRRKSRAPDHRKQRRYRALSVGMSDDTKTDHSGHKVLHLSKRKGCQHLMQRDSMRCSRQTDCDRIRSISSQQRNPPIERRSAPRLTNNGDEGISLSGRFQITLFRPGHRQSQFVDLGERLGIASIHRAPRTRRKNRVVTHPSVLKQSIKPSYDGRNV